MTDTKVVQYNVRYDEKSDVLYISIKPGIHGIAEESLPGILWRYSVDDGSIVGVTILDYLHYWASRLEPLSHDLESHLKISEHEVKSLLEMVR